MPTKYLLDTNILIYYFNNQPEVQDGFEAIDTRQAEGYYCPITWVELLCYPGLTEEQANEMRKFLRLINCVSLGASRSWGRSPVRVCIGIRFRGGVGV
ncbi:hypothetical protein NG793_26295, partial [Laspinema sp. C5]|nr:hypothetical protein [Laspinema sp. D3c]